MGALHDILVRRPPAGPAGSIGRQRRYPRVVAPRPTRVGLGEIVSGRDYRARLSRPQTDEQWKRNLRLGKG